MLGKVLRSAAGGEARRENMSETAKSVKGGSFTRRGPDRALAADSLLMRDQTWQQKMPKAAGGVPRIGSAETAGGNGGLEANKEEGYNKEDKS
ncbi:MAG: hypothetical protein ACLTEE_17985 [Anaerobutyricum hallii]